MLKANELMLGDLIYEGDHIHRVESLSEGCIDGMMEGCYSGIPLTAEILEKNGWIKHTSIDDEDDVFYKRDGFHLCLSFNNKNDALYVSDRLMGQYITFCTLTFIHELQHILKDAHLYELAENFTLPKNKNE